MSSSCDRRTLLSCGAYVTASLFAFPGLGRRLFAAESKPVVTTPFAQVHKVAGDVWAVVSTPVGKDGFHPETISNGGIVRGKDKVLVVEGFNTPAGAAWMSKVCKELTGRSPDIVVLTHFHGDHSAGLPGYRRGAEGPSIIATAGTRDLLMSRLHKNPPQAKKGETLARASRRLLLPDTIVVDTTKPTEIDLGGRTVQLVSHTGHTPSDLTVVVDKPHLVFCGDLYFNGFFPNFGDAIPTKLNATLAALAKQEFETYVPGHGPLSDKKAFGVYVEMIHHVEAAAREAIRKGTPAAEAWKSYKIPQKLGNWRFYRPDIARRAFEAWERELKGR